MKQPSPSALLRLQRSNEALLNRSLKQRAKLKAQVDRLKTKITRATPGSAKVKSLAEFLQRKEGVLKMRDDFIAEISKDISEILKNAALSPTPSQPTP